MSAPASPAFSGEPAAIDEPSESQPARNAGAATLARAARHPYGRRLFASAVAPDTRADTEEMRESQTEREVAAQAARESAARKTAHAVLPTYGRQEGALTQFQEDVVLPKTPLDFALLAAGGPFSPWVKVGALSLGALLDSTSDAEAGPLGKLLKAGVKSHRNLPTDLASRMERARKLGYADEPFYRGDRSGETPTKFPYGAFFSRDRDTAAGFARRGGQDAPTEYRLKLNRTFRDEDNLTGETLGRLLTAAKRHDPNLANHLSETFAPSKGVDWLLGFTKERPDFVFTKDGSGGIRYAVWNSPKRYRIFSDAGFDALDFGRDVLKLTGKGIRQQDARFDPRQASSHSTLASLLGLLALPAVGKAGGPRPGPHQE